jgi:transcription antitermination factor NusG
MNNWLVASYKTNEIERVKTNLSNQNFHYYLPKITTKKINSNSKNEILFPGYIFVHTSFENYSALKYTKGIKSIIRFGENFAYLTDEEIKNIKTIEELSILKPIISKVKIGQEMYVAKGSFKGIIVKICSLPSKQRVNVLMSFLGSVRKVNIRLNDLLPEY